MQVTGSIFRKPGEEGDFRWMIERPEYADALFIFNDNEEQFLAHQQDPANGCSPGGGNAVIRPYQCAKPPRATGVPTGSHADGGYPLLSAPAKQVIDQSIAAIRTLLATGRYSRVIYSAANVQGDLGTGIFQVGEDVKAYIVEELRKLAS